jgi:predicted ATP-dependent endonuclease of OLD family
MKLAEVRIQNFKSIKDSTVFTIDENVTCLVGKNESGKTATLQAIAKANAADTTTADFDELDFPRHELNDFQKSKETPPALTTTWHLEEPDVEALKSLIGESATSIKSFTLEKGYRGYEMRRFGLDEGDIIAFWLGDSGLMADERKSLDGLETMAKVVSTLEALPDPTARQSAFLEKLKATFGVSTGRHAVANLLQARIPKIAYFSQYMRMGGAVSVDDIKQRQANGTLEESHRVFLALLSMIGKDIEDLENLQEHERLIASLEGAQNIITQEIFRYWSQNRHLRVQFKFDKALENDPAPFNKGWILRTRIENTRHGVTTKFDERSAGFVWFFSFLIWFNQIKEQFGDNLLILLDEPGLSLHAKAQADLLRYIEERLTPKYQVIYTTHSPFMIDAHNLLRARTVEDVVKSDLNDPYSPEEEKGTIIGDKVLSTDKDTVFPLQACLGYEITQTLFIGEHTLLVEGPSEIMYLQWFANRLKKDKRVALDERWTICPCGGIDKIPAFLSLFTGSKLNIAVLTDIAAGQKTKIRNLRESKLLAEGRVLTIDMYVDGDEGDIEDLLGREFYSDLVKRTYGLTKGNSLPVKRGKDVSGRVVKEVEEHFRTLPATIDNFDHFRPAEFLILNGAPDDAPGLGRSLDAFEKLFIDLNEFLPHGRSASA